MPYKSQAQRKYFNANRAKLAREGVNVDEWNESSKGKKLPARAGSRKSSTHSSKGSTTRSHKSSSNKRR